MGSDATTDGGWLVCVMADGQATQLVAHAAQVCVAARLPWRVLHLDTVPSRRASAAIRADLEQALAQAQASGAELVRVSLAIDSATHLISTIVHQARAAQAGQVLLGNRAIGLRYWANFGERLSDFSEVLAASLPRTAIHILVAPGRGPRRMGPRPAGLVWPGLRGLLQQAVLPVGTVAVCTAICAAISSWLHPINLLLIFLVGVVHVALRRGLAASVFTVLLSVAVYDWIFVAPRWSFKPTDPEYFFTFAVMLGVGLAVGRLAARSRDASLGSLAQANRAQALSLLAQNLAKARTPEEIGATLVVAVERSVPARAVLLSPGEAVGEGAWVFDLVAGGEALGRLRVSEVPEAQRSAENQHLLQAFADQAAVALERHHHERRSAEVAIEAETERVRNTLLAGISHDFRTPLTTIIGAATTVLTQGGQITTEQRDALARRVLEQAQRLQALTSDLLDLARLQDGAVRPQCEWCPAVDLLQEAATSVAAAFGERPLVTQASDADVVWCDTRLVTQALVNLLLNAAQHSPPQAPVHATVRVGEGRWTLTVRDQGPGLTPGREQAVFRKFHRDTDITHGTGLGLAICEVVARLHGGGIAAHNDGGAVFEMWLPQPDTLSLPGADA